PPYPAPFPTRRSSDLDSCGRIGVGDGAVGIPHDPANRGVAGDFTGGPYLFDCAPVGVNEQAGIFGGVVDGGVGQAEVSDRAGVLDEQTTTVRGVPGDGVACAVEGSAEALRCQLFLVDAGEIQ